MRKRDPSETKRKPSAIGDVVTGFLKQSGLDERVDQAQVIPEWASLVGVQIAKVTQPRFVTADGTLFVAVKNNGWMTELSLLEPQLLRSINASGEREAIRKIRFQLRR